MLEWMSMHQCTKCDSKMRLRQVQQAHLFTVPGMDRCILCWHETSTASFPRSRIHPQSPGGHGVNPILQIPSWNVDVFLRQIKKKSEKTVRTHLKSLTYALKCEKKLAEGLGSATLDVVHQVAKPQQMKALFQVFPHQTRWDEHG